MKPFSLRASGRLLGDVSEPVLGHRHGGFRLALCLIPVVGLTACSTPKSDPPINKSKPTVSVKSQPLPPPVKPTRKPAPLSFTKWLKKLEKDARRYGIKQSTLDAAFKDARPIRRVIELDRNQPEFKLTYGQYMARVVPRSRILKARKKYAENRKLLEKVGKEYGVPPRFLVAFWGAETDFGRVMGHFPIVPSLATLAYDGRRSAFFRKELMNALKILDEGHVTVNAFKGSWAGAMGQCQFMPSTFVGYAIDEDGDGHKDLWGSKPDVFASAANYLNKMGWNSKESWGQKVTLPRKFDRKLANGQRLPLKTWAGLGVMDDHGKPLVGSPDIRAALIFPDKKTKAKVSRGTDVNNPPFLVYGNFNTILRWNRSTYYALAIGQLADAIVKTQ